MSDAYRAQLARRNAVEALQEAGEPLPDPLQAADDALTAVPWLYASDRRAVLDALIASGLTICWRV